MNVKHKQGGKYFLYFYERFCRYSFFFLGLWLMALGIVCTIQAELGVSPWDVLHIGLSYKTSLSIGFWVIAVGFCIVGITSLMTRRLPQMGTLLNMICVGFFVDFILYLNVIPHMHSWWGKSLLLLIGIFISTLGAGLYIVPEIGAGPRDGLTLELSRRLGWSIRLVRTIMEVMVAIVGWFLGGPVSVGTLFFCFFLGPLMQLAIGWCKGWLQFCLKRGVYFENIYKRALRSDHHDGFGC
ncbi:YczE/YyaS/YitT family protein [Thermoflavimicrobium dichotomicum]|uniref:Membrane protein YczE n=1 Tax=Thermoflavimicrobium dichotomicum TaxID=46223 RepID=A0A1I3MWF7_9BACL|nr:hypothetical protein [Thermoflavimicrobium dichotomicum]SFJ01100.1 hypothetical protein SAMN05421852_103225 [Thermoflavimicrobium dichotomicum]